ncbi:hypothetical protein OsI_23997 [Oryza sativa Indica Group]|uniref:Cryptochrome/DNA photolyase FAD-binding domain-containing protein n=1 Tax=Oryza sativa subsp. indica TaxID=39946 RepID=B8B103_ORYSI|nr:hypothetical protein OsI_23997 [Oryza sativa Indica Group]
MAVERAANADGQKITYSVIKHRMGDLFYRLVSQKFEDPAEGEDVLVAKFQKLYDDLTTGFRNLEDEARYPLIDANMKELLATGFMSNRGRQIVCSFLVRDMGIDWRMGAEWFETCLLDYDPASNYGNWTYGAG